MVFWRAKTWKKSANEQPAEEARAEAAAEAATGGAAPPGAAEAGVGSVTPEPAEAAATQAPAPKSAPKSAPVASNVVPLISSSRLSDRLASVGNITQREADADAASAPETEPVTKLATADATAADEAVAPLATLTPLTPLAPAAITDLAGQGHVIALLRGALVKHRSSRHLLVLGPAGVGRRRVVAQLAREAMSGAAHGPDWVYVADVADAGTLKPFAFSHGQGARFARDCAAALQRAHATWQRLNAGDDTRLARDLLDEQARERTDGAIDALRRRAEAQNIAVVRSLEGYVLAPMHEGRVVRADVFRALPETMRRDVEAKIAHLESELQALVAAQPEAELELADKYEALERQTALRALKPQLALVKKLYAGEANVCDALRLVERSALASMAGANAGAGLACPIVAMADTGAMDVAGARAPVIARDLSPARIYGSVTRAGHGALALTPGLARQADAGILIVEAWRLAANPAAWAALSSVLESGEVAPIIDGDVAVTAQPAAVRLRLVLIADPASWAKLQAIDPGIARHFADVGAFSETAAADDVPVAAFAASAAELAAHLDVRSLDASCAGPLHADALHRGGGRLSLDRIVLARLLQDADDRAADSGSEIITAVHLAAAASARDAGAVALP